MVHAHILRLAPRDAACEVGVAVEAGDAVAQQLLHVLAGVGVVAGAEQVVLAVGAAAAGCAALSIVSTRLASLGIMKVVQRWRSTAGAACRAQLRQVASWGVRQACIPVHHCAPCSHFTLWRAMQCGVCACLQPQQVHSVVVLAAHAAAKHESCRQASKGIPPRVLKLDPGQPA